MRSSRAARAAEAVTLIGTLAVVGCNGSTSSSTTGTGTASASVQTASSPSPTSKLPSTAQLEAALLEAGELGPAFAKESASPSPSESNRSDEGDTFKGCRPLAMLLNGGAGRSNNPQATVTFKAREGAVAVAEELLAEPPAALGTDYAATKRALESCDSITLVSAGKTIDFSLTPIHFGGPGSSAVRLDGTYRGVLVNGYIAIERLSKNVVLSYSFFQAGGGSSQLASAFYQLAVDKARTNLNL
ncbi:hypothetical protein OG870_17310 [Streptomyces sp. NBC_00461]|uniref:hypothetical protein n=1 Tax=Streptomyces sp. NBC_00461 TaxID=2975750 RepID=UPI002E19CDAF